MWTQIINYHKGVNEFSELIPGKDPTKYKTHFFQEEEEEGEYVVFPHYSFVVLPFLFLFQCNYTVLFGHFWGP